MEKFSKVSKKQTPKATVADEVFSTFIAQMEQTAPQQVTDPKMLQPGDTLLSQTGDQMTVIENDPATDNVVMAPSDQAQNVPEGTTTVQETELSSQYTMNPSEY